MRLFLIFALLFITIGISFGQPDTGRYGRINVEITKEKRPKNIYAKVKIILPFIGGDSAWVQSFERSLNRSFKYKNGAKHGKYIVSMEFILTKDNSLSEIRCVSAPVGFGMDEEVMRTLKRMNSNWTSPSGGIKIREYRY